MKNYHVVFGMHDFQEGWILKEEGASSTLIFSNSKEGLIKEAAAFLNLMGEPASMKIHDKEGKFQEERTYPRSADPTKTKG